MTKPSRACVCVRLLPVSVQSGCFFGVTSCQSSANGYNSIALILVPNKAKCIMSPERELEVSWLPREPKTPREARESRTLGLTCGQFSARGIWSLEMHAIAAVRQIGQLTGLYFICYLVFACLFHSTRIVERVLPVPSSDTSLTSEVSLILSHRSTIFA